jgi:hypothetical protein
MRITVYSVCSVFVTAALFLAAPSYAQAPQPPAAIPPAQAAPAEPVAPVIAIVGEEYRVEFSAGAWFTMPSTIQYSDTESLTNTVNGTTTTTVVNGTLVDFRRDLGLKDQTFPEGHLTVKLAPKHKLRGEYIPLQYKQTVASLGADFNFNGQTYKAGQTVESTLHWHQWKAAYEFDALTFDRGFVGGVIAASAMNISGAMANASQSGTANVTILMPGLGAIGRFYPSEKVSATIDFMAFDLPGGATSTHAHSIDLDGYIMYNFHKHAGVQVGYRLFDATHVWGSPLNTGSFTIKGPYVGGTARF